MEEEEAYSNEASATSNKKRKISPSPDTDINIDSKFALFDELPDDLVANIISKLGATASCPADFINLRLTCKRANKLSVDRSVLSKISPEAFCRAKNWSLEWGRFMISLVAAANVEALYTLGMIKFYIVKDFRRGKFMIQLAAIKCHPPAMYSMSVILFNGAGATKNEVNLKLALSSLVSAALVGHVDAIRELGYRFEGGNGIRKDPEEGKRLLQQATAREIISMLPTSTINDIGKVEWGRIPVLVPRSKWLASGPWLTWVPRGPELTVPLSECYFGSRTNFGWDLPVPVTHPVNRFLTEWFEIRGENLGNGLRLCSRVGCGRPETRKDEFLRCAHCMSGGGYCSRLCQTIDRERHYEECTAVYANYGDGDVNEEEENDENIAVDAIQDEEVTGEGDLEE